MFKSARMDEIHVVFENCEHIEIPYKDVRYIHLDGISESIWDNNVSNADEFDLSFQKNAKYLRLMIKDKPEYKRIKEHYDITWIEFLRYGEVIERIAIQWVGDNEDINLGQTVKEENGEIDIMVSPN